MITLQEKVVKVSELLHDSVSMVSRVGTLRGSNTSVDSPNGVLDAASDLSYKSDTTTTDFNSCANSSTNTPNNKRRKLDMSHEVVHN